VTWVSVKRYPKIDAPMKIMTIMQVPCRVRQSEAIVILPFRNRKDERTGLTLNHFGSLLQLDSSRLCFDLASVPAPPQLLE
jgi:hypothetical protein